MLRRRALTLIPVMLAATAASGCGYSLAGRGSFLPAYIKTIGVPLFTNNTPVFDVEQRITDRVRSELIGRGRYKVETGRTGVDAVLLGEIVSLTGAPAAFNPTTTGDAIRADPGRQSRVPRSQDRQGSLVQPRDAVHRTVRRHHRHDRPGCFRVSRPGRQRARAARLGVRARARERHPRGVLMPSATPAAVRKQVAQGNPDPLYLIVGDDDAEMLTLAGDFASLVEDELRAFNMERVLRDRQGRHAGIHRRVRQAAADDGGSPRGRRSACGEAAQAEASREARRGCRAGRRLGAGRIRCARGVRQEPGATFRAGAGGFGRRSHARSVQGAAEDGDDCRMLGAEGKQGRESRFAPGRTASRTDRPSGRHRRAGSKSIRRLRGSSRSVPARTSRGCAATSVDCCCMPRAEPKITLADVREVVSARDRAGRLGRHERHPAERCGRGAETSGARARRRRGALSWCSASWRGSSGRSCRCREPRQGSGGDRGVVSNGPRPEELGWGPASVARTAGD